MICPIAFDDYVNIYFFVTDKTVIVTIEYLLQLKF